MAVFRQHHDPPHGDGGPRLGADRRLDRPRRDLRERLRSRPPPVGLVDHNDAVADPTEGPRGQSTGGEAVRVALAQLDPTVGDEAKNLKNLEAAVAAANADLLLAGELFLSGYMARDAFAQLAEPLDGPAVKPVASIAQEHPTTLIFGMPDREQATQRLFNTSVLVAPRSEEHTSELQSLTNL